MIFDQAPVDRKVRVFSLSPSFVEEYEGQQPEWGFDGLGYFTYKRTYSRALPDGGTEEWWQTCKRVVEGVYNIQKIHCRQFHLPWSEPKAQRSAQDMFCRMWTFKFLPPGRGLWMMGTDVIYERGSAALNSCGFASTENIDVEFAAPFTFLMDMSMLGVGVGGDTRGKGKIKLQVPKVTDEPFVVEDSREGWVELIRVVLMSFVGKGRFPRTTDFSLVRKRGEPLKTFGGTSSGPKPLVDLVINLTRLLTPEGVKLSFQVGDCEEAGGPFLLTDGVVGKVQPYWITSAQIVDIFNFIGKAVVAGGIRRSSEIMFGDPDDQDFITLKQDVKALEDRRWVSNNSIIGTIGMDYSEIAVAVAKNGEPGVFWLDNSRAFSRMGDPPDHKDRRVLGTNPCGEQPLEDRELCNLVETFPAHHESFEDYKQTLKMAYLYAKTVTLVPTHDPRANAVMMRNRRIGCSMSGIQQAIKKLGRRAFLTWCDQGYTYLKELDLIYSEWLCIPRSIKMSSVKPSGTVSLLAGATPGVHHAHSEFYIRNIRVKNTSPLIQAAADAGYTVEPDTYADDTSVVSFPVKTPDFVRGKREVSIWEQFADAAAMQKHWADNQVSCSISFSNAEAQHIARCLEIYEDQLKAISLIPLEDHGYKQAPYIEISGVEYDRMVAKLSPLDLRDAVHEVTDKFCTTDKCMISPVR